MNVTALLDQTVGRVDNVGPVGADVAERRLRHLDALRIVFRIVWFHREWWFRRTSPTVTVAAGDGYAVMPANFLTIPYQGGVYNTATGERLDWVEEGRITELREGPSPLTTDVPGVYSVFGQDAATYRPLFQIPMNTSELTFKFWSDTDVPTLDESAGLNSLKLIPERWHDVVLIPGVRALLQESKGDPRYRNDPMQDPMFLTGLAAMTRTEKHGKESPKRLPSFWGA